MKRILWIVTLLISTVLSASASLTINAEAVKKSAVFIYPADANGLVEATKPLGTGFFVFVPYAGRPGGYLLLVTARHILNPAWAGCPQAALSKIFLRLNLAVYDPTGTDKGVEFFPVDLTGSDHKTKEFESSDPQIDGAVVVLNANDFVGGKYDYAPVPISAFATEEEISLLGTGDSIVSAGLVPGAQGERRNYPVFKFGEISNVMDEPFVTQCVSGSTAQVPEKVWLLSVNLYPGASGSAIFYTPPGSAGILFGAPVGRPCLIGVQSSSLLAADISAMTPIGPVFKIIEGLRLPNADLFRGVRPAPQPVTPTAPPTAPPPMPHP
jgi:hypothetical protein